MGFDIENIYIDDFFEKLDGVVNVFDNVDVSELFVLNFFFNKIVCKEYKWYDNILVNIWYCNILVNIVDLRILKKFR